MDSVAFAIDTSPNPYNYMRVGVKDFGSDSEQVITIENEFNEAVRAHSLDLQLMYECWDAYFAINDGQWDKKKLLKLRYDDRQAKSFDIIGPKVDTLAGALISELPDIDWIPIEGEKTTLTEAIKDSWYSDKELTNSEYEMMLTIRDGLVHIGWCQIVESTDYGKPVIGIKRLTPGFFIPSAYWIQESERQLKKAFKVGYLTPEEMKSKFETKSDEIDEAIRIIRRQGHEELPSNAYDQRRRFVGRMADHYKVLQMHYVENVKTTRLVGVKIEIDQSTGEQTGHIRWVPFPVTRDRAKLEHFAAVNQIEWETVEETGYTDTIHKVKTVAPDFDRSLILEDNKSKIQTRGLPFYKFTVSRYNGRNKGIVAALLDPQRTINERESLVTELISKANGGSDIIDDSIFKDAKDRERFVKNANKPGWKHFIDTSQLRPGAQPIYNVGANQYPSQVLDQIDRMYTQVIPLVSRVSDSMSAISQSGKSGILFEREIQVNRIGNLLMDKSIKQMIDGIAEGYYYQWQISYAGRRYAT
jgi:hypothetical protein